MSPVRKQKIIMREQTESSLESYHDQGNKEVRLTHKQKIKIVFEDTNIYYTIREMQLKCGLPYNATQKRMSDLEKEDWLEIVGKKMEGTNSNSVYRINPNPYAAIIKKKAQSRPKISFIETGIAESPNGHQAWFRIDNQVFYLHEDGAEEGKMTTADWAEWFRNNLEVALNKLKPK